MSDYLYDRVQKYWREYIVMGWHYHEIVALENGMRRVILVSQATADVAGRLNRLWKKHGLHSRAIKAAEGNGVIAFKDPRWADDFEKATLMRDVDTRGRLLGYPACCRKFHLNEPGDVDQLCTHRRSKNRFHFLLNNLSGDIRLISHFPCSYDCKASIKIARKTLNIIRKKHGDKSADDIADVLKHKVVYYNGICFPFQQLDTPFFPTRFVIGQCGIKEDDRIIIRRKHIFLLPKNGKSGEIMKKHLLFDFE